MVVKTRRILQNIASSLQRTKLKRSTVKFLALMMHTNRLLDNRRAVHPKIWELMLLASEVSRASIGKVIQFPHHEAFNLNEAISRVGALMPESAACSATDANQSIPNNRQVVEQALSSCKDLLLKIKEGFTACDDSCEEAGEERLGSNDVLMTMDPLIESLATDRNNLTLIACFLECGMDAGAEALASTHKALEVFCGWLLDRHVYRVFTTFKNDTESEPDASLPLSLVRPSSPRGMTHLSHVRIVPLSIDAGKGATSQKDVCPNAKLLHNKLPHKLEFSCRCKTDDHSQNLIFDIPFAQTIPILQIQDEQEETWCTISPCRFAGTSVSVLFRSGYRRHQISQHSGIDENTLPLLWNHLARNVLASSESNPRNLPSDRRLLRISEDRKSVLSSIACTGEYSGSLVKAAFILGQDTVNLSLQQPFVQLLHYRCIGNIGWKFQSKIPGIWPVFTDENHYSVFIGDLSTYWSCSSMAYTIQVFDDTNVIFDGCRVTFNNVGCLQVENSVVLEKRQCDQATLTFKSKIVVEEFSKSLRGMKDWILQRSLRGPVFGERSLYQREFGSPTSKSRYPGLRVAIFKEAVPNLQSAKFRIVLCPRGCHESISLTASPSWLEDVMKGPPFRFKHSVQTLRLNEKGRPFRNRLKWNELFPKVKNTPSHPSSSSSANRPVGTFTTRDGESSSTKWFEEWELVSRVLRTPMAVRKIRTNYKPIKIAVIDTGVDPIQNLTIKYKDFVNGDISSSQQPPDRPLQHGTQSVHLILRMYDRAELFVAKVFESDEVDERTAPEIMAKAVEWAVEQQVDIISISAGFRDDSPPLRLAIQKAHGDDIMVFAAAANWGNRGYAGGVAYPARMKDHVLCMFATTGNLKSLREINPEPRDNADNFAMLGHDIELVGPSGPVRVSGTSAATALAAGMAARILDFERHYEHPTKDILKPSMLRSKSGITAVFKALSYRSENYDCISPSKMLSLVDHDEDVILDPKAGKKGAWEFIRRALKNPE